MKNGHAITVNGRVHAVFFGPAPAALERLGDAMWQHFKESGASFTAYCAGHVWRLMPVAVHVYCSTTGTHYEA